MHEKRILKRTSHWALLLVGLVLPARAQIAVVAHPDCNLESVSEQKLARLYWGEITSLAENRAAMLAELEPARKDFYAKLLQRSPKEVALRWLKVVLSGNSQQPPAQFRTAAEVKHFVAANADAVAFLPVADIDSTVKVLALDGRSPGHPDYPLR